MSADWSFLRALFLAAVILAALQTLQSGHFQQLEARIWWAELRAQIWEGPR